MSSRTRTKTGGRKVIGHDVDVVQSLDHGTQGQGRALLWTASDTSCDFNLSLSALNEP